MFLLPQVLLLPQTFEVSGQPAGWHDLEGLSAALGLGLRLEARQVDQRALVRPLPDQVRAIVRADAERQAPPLDADELGARGDGRADGRRGQVADVDQRADGLLAGARCAASALTAARSMRRIISGVAKTDTTPLPRCRAVSGGSTTMVASPVRPRVMGWVSGMGGTPDERRRTKDERLHKKESRLQPVTLSMLVHNLTG